MRVAARVFHRFDFLDEIVARVNRAEADRRIRMHVRRIRQNADLHVAASQVENRRNIRHEIFSEAEIFSEIFDETKFFLNDVF